MKHTMSGEPSSLPCAKRRRLAAAVSADAGSNLAAARILQSLSEQGHLTFSLDCCSIDTLRKDASLGMREVTQAMTPYGTLIAQLCVDGVNIEVVNPFAYVHYLCSRSRPIFDALSTRMCRQIVIYLDEVRPGNPLRADKCRQAQCIYWVFADLPDKVLTSASGWFLGAVIKSTTVDSIPGKVTGFMGAFMKYFFDDSGHSWSRGVVLQNGNDTAVLTAEFGGFLADEKALKEIYCLKGASGIRPCPWCCNVVNFIEDLPDTLVGIGCADRARLRYATDGDIFAMVDRLASFVGTKAALGELEKACGMNNNPKSLLMDPFLRTIVKPCAHYLRDWMHTIVNHGVAGTETALLLKALQDKGVTLAMIARYAANFVTPKAQQPVSDYWFAANRVGDDHMRLFAGEMLAVVPILNAFLEDAVRPSGELVAHLDAYDLMARILALLQMGPSAASRRRAELAALIDKHHAKFVEAYGEDEAKPKWHHMIHLPEHGPHLNRILSCFTAERKHKDTKRAATNLFNEYDSAVLRKLLYQQVQALSLPDLWVSETLIRATSRATNGHCVSRSKTASIHCGEAHCGDVVARIDRTIVKVSCFLQVSGCPAVFVHGFTFAPSATPHTFVDSRADVIFQAAEVVQLLMHAPRGDGAFRVILPSGW
jgi:hypothetical protein